MAPALSLAVFANLLFESFLPFFSSAFFDSSIVAFCSRSFIEALGLADRAGVRVLKSASGLVSDLVFETLGSISAPSPLLASSFRSRTVTWSSNCCADCAIPSLFSDV